MAKVNWINGSIISTHALREEGDMYGITAAITSPVFLPTPSARRATSGEGQTVGGKVKRS